MSSEIDRLKQAAARDPAQLVRLADTLVASGRAEEAVVTCKRGLQVRPDDNALRLALGRALMASGRLEEAQAALTEAAARQRHQPVSRRQRATEPGMGRRREREPTPTPATSEWGHQPLPNLDSQPSVDSQPIIDEYAEEPTRKANRASFRGSTGPRPALDGGTDETIDLERVADELLGSATSSSGHEGWDVEPPAPPPDPYRIAFDGLRARSFVWLWTGLVLLVAGIVGGYVWRSREKEKLLAELVAKADARVHEATYEGDLAARESFAQAVRLDPRSRRYFAMVALGAARLAADHGGDTDAAAWAMLRRSEREAQRHKQDPDARTERELRQARALLALHRGEACPEVVKAADASPEPPPPNTAAPLVEEVDGDVAARCLSQKGDVAGARRILSKALAASRDGDHLRELLALGSIELGAGDLDAADGAFRRVLAVAPQHPRALVGRALVTLERGEAPNLTPPPVRLGLVTEAWLHLAAGLKALNSDESKASTELELARQAIPHDGRLALLYGRARLEQGKVGEAEQAMRIAEHLDPNDGDVAVLDAEVALAKGYEDKVVSALSPAAGAPVGEGSGLTPRHLAVLGRALCLTGRYREAASTLDAALARRPGDATAITYRAIARAHLGDQSGALKQLEKVAGQLSSTAPRYGLGLLAYERHDLLKARAELTRALDHNSESFRARALLGRVLRDLGKPKDALAELKRAAQDAPALASVHQALGRLYLDLGRDRETRSELKPVIDEGKASADDKLAYAEATIDLGLQKEGEEALQAAADAGALQPKLAHLRAVLAALKSPKDAQLAAKQLELERRGQQAHDARLAVEAADAWRRAGDLKRAGDDYRAALWGDPLHANLGLGRLELAGADPSQAEASFRAALKAWESGPYGLDDQTEARIGLARALFARKAFTEAITTLEPALADDPQAPDPAYWLARAYAESGSPAEARKLAEKATKLDDQFADAHLLLGELTRSTDKAKARVAFKRYLELQPNGEGAKAAKKGLASLR